MKSIYAAMVLSGFDPQKQSTSYMGSIGNLLNVEDHVSKDALKESVKNKPESWPEIMRQRVESSDRRKGRRGAPSFGGSRLGDVYEEAYIKELMRRYNEAGLAYDPAFLIQQAALAPRPRPS